MSELEARLGLRRGGNDRVRALELALWAAAIGAALVFAAIKIAAWGPLDAPEQSDFGSYYLAARVSQVSPNDIYHPESPG